MCSLFFSVLCCFSSFFVPVCVYFRLRVCVSLRVCRVLCLLLPILIRHLASYSYRVDLDKPLPHIIVLLVPNHSTLINCYVWCAPYSDLLVQDHFTRRAQPPAVLLTHCLELSPNHSTPFSPLEQSGRLPERTSQYAREIKAVRQANHHKRKKTSGAQTKRVSASPVHL